ncbi:MAG: hypothetical protein FWD73_04745 [Polyangiaceae bacterium]|nr:hypothetical protein [Polyangiaceae bacterium]
MKFPRTGRDPRIAKGALWTAGNLAITLATLGFVARPALAALLREITSLGAGLFAIRALFSIDADFGLAPLATEARAARGLRLRSLERYALAAVAAAWGSPAVVDALAVFRSNGSSYANMAPLAAATGGTIALVSMGASSLLVARVRRLELGVTPRALACAAASGGGILVGVALALTSKLEADASIALGAASSAVAFVAFAHAKNPRTLARRGRRALVLATFGGPLVVIAFLIASSSRASGSGLVLGLVFGFGALVVGAFSNKLEEHFLPLKGALLHALEGSRHALQSCDSGAAIAHVLARLRDASGTAAHADAASPELWMLHPTRVCTVDAAGYLHERAAELPALLFDIAKNEPDFTVRVDVLRALEVRRSDLRPLCRWLESRDGLFATLIAEDGEPDGLLIVPAAARREPLIIEEIHCAKVLADAFVSVCQTRSAHARHLTRERELANHIEALQDQIARLNHIATLDAGRHKLATVRLARPATAGIYSPSSRMAYDAVERRLERDAPLVVVAHAGVDPVPYIARAHLTGPRKEAPLVIVDGTSSQEHDLARWKNASTSPFALARQGLLVLVDGGALPCDIQLLVARALMERRPPWGCAIPLDVGIAFTATAAPSDLAEQGRLAPELFARFEEAPVIVLPSLHERHEDLYSIVADRLAREGLRVRGRPVGIDDAAFARLVEHSFDGGDAELAAIVTRLVAELDEEHNGDVVRAAHVDAAADILRSTQPISKSGRKRKHVQH